MPISTVAWISRLATLARNDAKKGGFNCIRMTLIGSKVCAEVVVKFFHIELIFHAGVQEGAVDRV